jgi:hypothetical protein
VIWCVLFWTGFRGRQLSYHLQAWSAACARSSRSKMSATLRLQCFFPLVNKPAHGTFPFRRACWELYRSNTMIFWGGLVPKTCWCLICGMLHIVLHLFQVDLSCTCDLPWARFAYYRRVIIAETRVTRADWSFFGGTSWSLKGLPRMFPHHTTYIVKLISWSIHQRRKVRFIAGMRVS